MNILYLAQFHETCGYSHAAIGYLKSLSSVLQKYKDFNLKIISTSLNGNFLKEENYSNKIPLETLSLIDKHHILDQEELNSFLKEEYVCLWHMTSVMPIIEKRTSAGAYYRNLSCNLENLILGAKQNYHILAWETDNLCDEYAEVIKNYKPEMLFAPSKWNKETFEKKFKSVYVPHLIEERDVASAKVDIPHADNKFKILSVSEWTNRKNFQCLIKSYITEFQGQDDVLLILKTSLPAGVSKDAFVNHFSQIKDSIRTHNAKPEIAIIINYLSDSKIKYLYEISDVFCTTSFGEGFSLPTSEAALMSKPVISPKEGGHVDFLSPENKYFINGIWDTVFDNPPYDSNAMWFIPTVNSTRAKMRLAYTDWLEGTLMGEGRKNKQTISAGNFSREAIGNKIFNIIQNEKEKDTCSSRVASLKRKIQNKDLSKKISTLKDKFIGQDCYILNCGPSLLEHDPEKLKNFLKNKLTFTVKQAFDIFKDVADFHFFNCSNLPARETMFQPHYENKPETIVVSSSNYDQYHRWSLMQNSDIFFKIPIRTEINNEFLVRTAKINDYLLKNNLTRPCGPGIMYETVLFMAIHLGVKSITALGWDLTMDTVTEESYKHFYGSTENLQNRGDILNWEIEETRKFSKTFYYWCVENNIDLSLVSNQSSLYHGIPRKKLEL